MASCPSANRPARQPLLQIDTRTPTFTVALAGNPNTGKSCVFNQLTGLRQHVGNWPGKTVQRAEGRFDVGERTFKLVDLPGTYSLQSTSTDEEIARDFLLFGQPDVTVVVLDATCLERNLNLALQVLEITSQVVVCLNLVDEAARKGIRVDEAELAARLGVPVVRTVANRGTGLRELAETVAEVATGALRPTPRRAPSNGEVLAAAERLVPPITAAVPGILNARWVAIRLREQDDRIVEALGTGELERQVAELSGRLPDHDQGEGSAHDHPHWHSHAHGDAGSGASRPEAVAGALAAAERERLRLGSDRVDELVADLYEAAADIAADCVETGAVNDRFERTVDRLVTSPVLGLLGMAGLLGIVFWLTIAGANLPSAMLAEWLFKFEGTLDGWFSAAGAPWWLTGLLVHGIYRAVAWVVSVMLPPMAIFFPLFTLLEDLGYLPRVAFNLDRLFRAAGAHGKQSLTMAMGFGCNAAGVTACRIIDSPRERLIAIVTNDFVPCNGRFPTLLMLATVFVSPLVGHRFGSLAAAATLVGCVMLGIGATLLVSWLLSRTWLKGEPSAFILELPSYRRPRVMQVLYTSILDRTLFVLWRAVIFAAPAGLVIWLLGNLMIGDRSAFAAIAGTLDPVGRWIGLDGVILLAYVVAIPANEIVVPTIFMGYNVIASQAMLHGQRVMVEMHSFSDITTLLVGQQGWTLVTAICLILFCLMHNPCSTTLYTIYKETHSRKWTVAAALIPLAMGFATCFLVAQTARLLGW